MRLLGLSAVFIILVNCGASAQGQFENCSGPNLDIRIAACSALIQAHPENVSDFSSIYNNRGSGYAAKGQLDQAILDYSQAIYLNSNFALAYSNRGAAYEALGRIELALQDYDKAIALAPDFRVAYNNRCYALAELGHPEEGLKDCDKAVT
ncbi:MAG TPA: tetratricopeptide repeat protein, partial [Micropepsaceae bacterium]|nr:tetratricopeptide repeat protein [Micropepsaceae bacterium]